MSTPTGAVSPAHRRAAGFRELISLFLETKGLPTTFRPPHRVTKSLSARFAAPEQPLGDLWGLPGWLVTARVEATRDLSGVLDQAEREAEAAGLPAAAVIWRRPGRPIEEAYTVMSLRSFAHAVKEAHGAE